MKKKVKPKRKAPKKQLPAQNKRGFMADKRKCDGCERSCTALKTVERATKMQLCDLCAVILNKLEVEVAKIEHTLIEKR